MIEVIESTEPEKTVGFPKLMKSNGGKIIALMLEENINGYKGIALSGPHSGDLSGGWDKTIFKDYNGSITITNKKEEVRDDWGNKIYRTKKRNRVSKIG